MKKNADRQVEDQVKDEILDLIRLEEKFKEVKKKYEDKKKKLTTSIKNFMYIHNTTSMSFSSLGGDSKSYSVKKVQRVTVNFDPEKVEQQIDEDLHTQFVTKRYAITDIDGLIKYLKSCGVSAKRFKSFITVEKGIDRKALDNLIEIGEITMDELEGCYEVKESESYLRFNIKENECEE